MNMMKTRTLACTLVGLILLTGISSCGDDNDESAGAVYRVVVTLNAVVANDDFVSVTVTGTNQSTTVIDPLWRVNGVAQANQTLILLDAEDFSGGSKTYEIESIVPIDVLASGVQVINYGSPLTGSYRIEREGKVMVSEIINLTGDDSDFTKDYTFNK